MFDRCSISDIDASVWEIYVGDFEFLIVTLPHLRLEKHFLLVDVVQQKRKEIDKILSRLEVEMNTTALLDPQLYSRQQFLLDYIDNFALNLLFVELETKYIQSKREVATMNAMSIYSGGVHCAAYEHVWKLIFTCLYAKCRIISELNETTLHKNDRNFESFIEEIDDIKNWYVKNENILLGLRNNLAFEIVRWFVNKLKNSFSAMYIAKNY